MTGIGRPLGEPDPFVLGAPVAAGPTKVDEITDRLFTAIAVGEYLPGSKLPRERELADQLRVSRVTLREALARLARDGVIETKRGRGGGSFVRTASGPTTAAAVQRSLDNRWDEIVDAIEAVGRLQETIVRAAAENRTDDDLARLNQLLDAFRRAETGRPRQHADEALHLGICDAAHNRTLTRILITLERTISIAGPSHLWGDTADHETMESRALDEHTELVRLIAARSAEQGGALARRHAHIDLELLESARRRLLDEPSLPG